MNNLGDVSFVTLLPESIRGDATLNSAAQALDALLRKTTLAVPNLLTFARLDRENAQAFPPLARLITAAGGLKALPTELLERLAWQFHVDFRETAKTNAQLEALVRNSIPWHRIKGTPASLKAAFALFGHTVGIEEDGEGDYWATYQLGLSQIADLETVKEVCRLAYEMQPARCSLYRIYTDVWDVRPGSYDVGFYDVAAYDYYSGVPVPGLPDGGDVIVSFGQKHMAQSAPPVLTLLYLGRARTRGAKACEDDEFLYDTARYDVSLAPHNHGFVRSRLNSIVIGKVVYRKYTWTGAWDDRKWLDIDAIEQVRDPFFFAHKRFAANEGVYGESAYDEAFYEQPLFSVVDNPARYDADAYDAHDPGRRTVLVDEVFYHDLASGVGASLLADTAALGVRLRRFGEHQAVTAHLLTPPARWTGGWDARTWRAGGAFANLTHEEIV
jgi:hypothetical protein